MRIAILLPLILFISTLRAQPVPFQDPKSGKWGIRNENTDPQTTLLPATYDSIRAAQGEFEEMFLVWSAGKVGIVGWAGATPADGMEEKIPVQYRAVQMIGEVMHGSNTMLFQDATGRWAIVNPQLPYGKSPFVTGFIIREFRLFLDFLWLSSDLGVTYVSAWSLGETPIIWYAWVHSFLGDRCPSNSSESVLVRDGKGRYGFYYFEGQANCKYSWLMPVGDSCAAENWLFRDTKGAYGLVTPYGDELYFYDSRVVPLPEMISPHMIDRFVIPFKMTGKDGQEWIGMVDGDYISASPVFLKSQVQSDPKLLDFFNKEWFSDGQDYLSAYGLPVKNIKLRPDLYWISFAKGKALFAHLESNEQQINDIDFVEPEYPVSEVRVIPQAPNLLLASTLKGKGQKEWGVIDRGGSIFIEPLYDAINVSVAADGTLRFACTLKGKQIVYNQDGMEVK